MVTTSADRRARVALAVDGDRWVASLGGYHDDHPPMDWAGFLAFAETLAGGDPRSCTARNAERPTGIPLQPPAPAALAAVPVRYERLRVFPAG